MRDLLRAAIEEHREVVAAFARTLESRLPSIVEELVGRLRAGGKAIAFGNGGSAADAQHFAAELTGRYRVDRRALPGVALTTDTSALTAIANDYGYDEVFARQVRAHARPGDVAFGLSTSGNSENVCRGLAAAREIGALTVALSGESGGRMVALADHVLLVPSRVTARIQEAHALALHLLCEAVEREFVDGTR